MELAAVLVERPARQKYGGRQKGGKNIVQHDVRELAQAFGPSAVRELARIATQSDQDSARVSAIKELLDRAYGKAPVAITGNNGGPIAITVSWLPTTNT